MSQRLFVSVYRSNRREGMYLFVERGQSLEELPESLTTSFGTPEPVLDLVLTPERKLARASAPDVLEAIAEQGFYLQMPPSKEELEAELAAVAASRNRSG